MRPQSLKSFIQRMLAPVLIGLLFVCSAAAQAQTKLSVALARNTITPAEEIFTFAVPKHKGYFATEGIAPSILKANGSMAAVQLVTSGHAQVGFASSVNIAAAVEKGIPIKAIGGLTIQWPYFTAVLKGSSIKKMTDLRGKKVGVISMASASYADLKANLHYAGMTEADVRIIPVGTGVRAATALAQKHVDAVVSYADSFERMRQNGVALDMLPRAKEMEELFSVSIFTSEETLKKHPDLLTKFVRSAYKGIIYSYLFPDEALALGFKEFPELAGSKDPQSKDAQNTKKVMQIALAEVLPKGKPNPETWGQWLNISNQRWQNLLAFSLATGQINKPLTVDQVWDSSLMKDIYSFDVKQISK